MSKITQYIQKNLLLFILILLLMSTSILSTYKFLSIRPLENIVGFYQEENPTSPLHEFNFWDNRFQLTIDGEKLDDGTFEQYGENTFVLSGQNKPILITLLNSGFYYINEISKKPVFLIKKHYVPVNLN